MDFDQLIEKTKKIDRMFKKRLDKRDRMLDMVEEVGELAQAMLVMEKRKITNDPAKRRTKKRLADALADVLYDLILISEDYQVDLGAEYRKMLVELEKRIKKGEFNENE